MRLLGQWTEVVLKKESRGLVKINKLARQHEKKDKNQYNGHLICSVCMRNSALNHTICVQM